MNDHLRFLLLFIFLLGVSPGAALAGSSATEPRVSFQSGYLSVDFHKVPIQTALERIASQTGIPIFFDPSIEGSLSARFERLPLETGLRRLLRNQSHAFVYLNSSAAGARIGSVKVFRRGQQASTKFVVLGNANRSVHTGIGTEKPNKTNKSKNETEISKTLSAENGLEGAEPPTALPSADAINPHSVAAQTQLMQGISKVQNEMAYLQRKSAGEERALHQRMSEKQFELAQSGGNPDADPRKTLDQLKQLEEEKARLDQANALRIIEKQKELQKLYEKLADLSSPAERARSQSIQQQQQAAIRRNQAASRAMAEREAQALKQMGQ